jgi:hypothetical protein
VKRKSAAILASSALQLASAAPAAIAVQGEGCPGDQGSN